MQNLERFVKSICGATDSEWQNFWSLIKVVHFKAGESLFNQGEFSEMIGFVNRGLVYSYYMAAEGEMRVKKFAWEGRIVSPYSTLISGAKICYFSAEAVEDSEVFVLNYSDLQKLLPESFAWQKLGRRLVEESLVEREKREYEMLCLPLSERYQNFIVAHQNILNRVPQYLIASFLGVDASSLSRLRAKRSRKMSELLKN